MEKVKQRQNSRLLANPEHYAPLLAIHNEREYDTAVSELNRLVDEVGDHPNDPRYRFVETLSLLIESYDEQHHRIPDVSGADLLKFLMEQHGLSQGEVPEVGSQGVVSEVLCGKRRLNVRQIDALSRRFNLPPGAFFSLAAQARVIRSARGKLHWEGDLETMRLDRPRPRRRKLTSRG